MWLAGCQEGIVPRPSCSWHTMTPSIERREQRMMGPRTSSGPFTIYLAGMDGSRIDLELSFKDPFGISFWLYDQSDGLAVIGFSATQRPNGRRRQRRYHGGEKVLVLESHDT
jgi:hypothetical protein